MNFHHFLAQHSMAAKLRLLAAVSTVLLVLTQIERQASGFSPRFERSGRNGLLLLNVLPQYFNRGTAA